MRCLAWGMRFLTVDNTISKIKKFKAQWNYWHGLPPALVVSTDSCSDKDPIVMLAADVTVGCKDRPDMGWITTLAGTAFSAAWREGFCGAILGSPVSCWASKLLCCNVCCRRLGSIWKASFPSDQSQVNKYELSEYS